jgi:hypothetical protein
MQKYLFLYALILLLAACQGQPGQGDLYVYTDAQGNLVTIEKPEDKKLIEADGSTGGFLLLSRWKTTGPAKR